MVEVEVQDAEPTQPVGALIVPFTLPPVLARVRRRWDYAASVGIGPHVTILFPFISCAELGPAARRELAAMARAVNAFEVRFERVRRFPDLVWVEPDPAEPFAALTRAVVDRWPSHPPYGGEFEVVVPHLTVVESATATLDEIEDLARQVTPFTGSADRLELWCEDSGGRWRTRWRLPFGIRP
jgi:2'-5' RNA ligase